MKLISGLGVILAFACPELAISDSEGVELANRGGVSHASALRPITVADSIAMTQLVEPPFTANNATFKFSSDRSHFVVITRRGNLGTGQNNCELILYRTDEVLDFVNNTSSIESATSFSGGKTLVSFSSVTNEDAIRDVRWLSDNRTLAFIGENSDQRPSQVYNIDIRSKKLRQLTDHSRSVEAFVLNEVSGRLVYASTIATYPKGRSKSSYVVGVETLANVMNRDAEVPYSRQYQYFTIDPGGRGAVRTLGEPFVHGRSLSMWNSQNDRWGVAAMRIKDEPLGDWVNEYAPIANNSYFQLGLSLFDENTMNPLNTSFYQFVLIDMLSGDMRPIFDAPAASAFFGQLDAQWLPDGETVILASTFLPLDVLDPQERERRSLAPAIVEYSIRTGRVSRIMDLVADERDFLKNEKLVAMILGSDGLLTIKMTNVRGQNDLPDKHYRKRQGQWVRVEFTEADSTNVTANQHLELSIKQDLNTPPEVLARDVETGKAKVITDLNPGFRERAFGKVELFDWTDTSGRNWQAGLVYPTNYQKSQRYPLVIQTHGFESDQFLIDGPHGTTSAFAAQALANRGMLVLQIHDQRLVTPEAFEIQRTQIESLIDELDRRGLIDRKRVGIIGFSATTLTVQHLITFSDYKFAAATIADSLNFGLFGYAAWFGNPAPGMGYIENMSDAVPWGESLTDWVTRNPTMHLDRVNTPLRLEYYDSGPLSWWDVYALLRRQQKPVEMISIPDGSHGLVKPSERFVSQQGNVDWFDFWLNGRERTEPHSGTPETKESLAEQYKRWRKLRELQAQSEIDATAARQWHREEAARREVAEAWLQKRGGSKSGSRATGSCQRRASE